MNNSKEVFERAYGNVPKKLPNEQYIWDWIPTRGVKYWYLTLWRKLFR